MTPKNLSTVIPEAAKQLSGIHSPGIGDTDKQGLWIPGSLAALAPRNDRVGWHGVAVAGAL
jgi:hypothetical protein